MSDRQEQENKGMNRRKFLQLLGTTAAAAAIPQNLKAGTATESFAGGGEVSDYGFWKKVQGAFTLDPDRVYMNIGTTGSMPRKVLNNYNRYNRLVASDPWDMGGEFGKFPHVAEMIEAIAPSFGADTGEIVLSRNTTDGMGTILGGLQFEPGDEILTTHHEHLAAISPLTIVAKRYGARVKYLEIPVYPTHEDQFVEEDIVNLFRENINNNTKLITFSHITYKTGTRLPARAICHMARDYGVLTLVDGAHTPGMINLDFHDIGCDFYAGSGHKWQCGPGATGILYVNSDSVNPQSFYAINSSLYPYLGFFNLATVMQYIGNDNFPAKRALKDACVMWDEIGRDRIEEYVLSLSSYCKQRIAQVFGGTGTFFAPDIPEFSSGLTSFNPFDNVHDLTKLNEFRDRLREEYGYIIRTTDFKILNSDPEDTHALRISTHLFHDVQQVDGLVDAMYDLYLQMA